MLGGKRSKPRLPAFTPPPLLSIIQKSHRTHWTYPTYPTRSSAQCFPRSARPCARLFSTAHFSLDPPRRDRILPTHQPHRIARAIADAREEGHHMRRIFPVPSSLFPVPSPRLTSSRPDALPFQSEKIARRPSSVCARGTEMLSFSIARSLVRSLPASGRAHNPGTSRVSHGVRRSNSVRARPALGGLAPHQQSDASPSDALPP